MDFGTTGNLSATNKKTKPQFIVEELNEQIEEVAPTHLNLQLNK